MSGAAFSFSIELAPVQGGLAAVRELFEDLTPILDNIGAEGEASTAERFDTNIAPDGTPWAPSLRVQQQGGRTLVLNRDLADSINYQLDGPDAVEWGSGLIYAAIHQAGGEIRARNGGALAFTLATGQFVVVEKVTMPARPYLGLSTGDQAEILDIVSRHITEAAQLGSAG